MPGGIGIRGGISAGPSEDGQSRTIADGLGFRRQENPESRGIRTLIRAVGADERL